MLTLSPDSVSIGPVAQSDEPDPLGAARALAARLRGFAAVAPALLANVPTPSASDIGVADAQAAFENAEVAHLDVALRLAGVRRELDQNERDRDDAVERGVTAGRAAPPATVFQRLRATIKGNPREFDRAVALAIESDLAVEYRRTGRQLEAKGEELRRAGMLALRARRDVEKNRLEDVLAALGSRLSALTLADGALAPLAAEGVRVQPWTLLPDFPDVGAESRRVLGGEPHREREAEMVREAHRREGLLDERAT